MLIRSISIVLQACFGIAVLFLGNALHAQVLPLDMYESVYWNTITPQKKQPDSQTLLLRKLKPKRQCVLYGNCQLGVIGRFLQETYPDDYEYTHVFNWRVINRTDPYPEDKFKQADLFIYQPIEGHGKCDTDYLQRKLLKKGCKCASLPYLYFAGYFPDHFNDPNNLNTVSPEFPVGAFPHGHQHIVYYIERGLCTEQIIQKSMEDDFLTADFILTKTIESLNILREKEKKTDVRIANFIEANYSKFKLFHTVSHPCNEIFKQVLKQLLPKLKYKTDKVDNHPMFKTELMTVYSPIIYPCVAKTLNLQFDTQGSDFWGIYLSYADFIREYIKRLYPAHCK